MTETASLVIKVDSSGARTASRDLDRLTDQAGKSERVAHKMGKAWGTAIGLIGSAAVIGGIRAVIKATIEQERVTSQLEARLKSTGHAAGLTKGQLLDMAAGLQQVTTYADESIVEAQSLLLTFTKIGREVFPQATETVLDMSTALGQGLKESAIQLGKALNDPIQGVTALRRVGVQLSESQEDLIKKLVETGKTAEAQRVILAELETQMGGSARAARDTLGGAIDGLKNAFGDLLEGDGDGVRGTKDAIEELTTIMSSSATKQAFQTVVNGLISAAGAAVEATTKIVEFIGQYNNFLANRGFLQANSDRTVEQLQQRRAKLRGLLGEFGGGGRDGPQSEANGLQRFFVRATGSADELRAELTEIDKLVKGFPFRNVSSSVLLPEKPGESVSSGEKKTGSAKKGRKMPDFAKDAADELMRLIKIEAEARQSFAELEAQLAGPLSEAAFRFGENQRELNDLAKVGAIDADRLAKAQANLRDEYEKEVEAIKESLDPTAQLIRDMEFELSLIGLTNVEREKAIALRYADASATQEQRNAISELAEAMVRGREAEALMYDFQRTASSALSDFVTGAKSAKEAFIDMFDAMAERITQMIAERWMEQLFKGGQDSGGKGGWFNSLFGAFFGGGGFAKGAAFSGGQVTAFANGGVVNSPTLFPMSKGMGLMGEAGPEAVMPLRRGRDGKLGVSGGGGTTNITINVPRNFEYRTVQQVAQEAGAAVNRANRRNG